MSDTRKKTKKKKSSRLNFADLVIPIISGTIFILVLFFILIPSVNSSRNMLLEIEKIEKEREILKANLTNAQMINFVDLQRDLSNARKVLPRRLEVAQFAYYIDNLAKEKGLDFRGLKAGDIAISDEDISILDVKGIRVPMGYSGDYNPILDFFNELQLVSPYVISFGHKVELNKLGSESEGNVKWSLEIDVTSYYVEEDQHLDTVVNFSAPLKPYDTQQEMVDEFAERVERLID